MKKLFPKIFQYTNVKKGFTLIETLIAITVLMLAVTGPLVISQKGLSAAGYAKDQMTAYYLAQDAMEYVRNVRDANVLGGASDWLSVVSGSLSLCNATSCTIDTRPSSEAVATCGSTCPLQKNNTGLEFYGYGSGEPTIFTRTVRIEKPDGTTITSIDLEAKVTVVVSWQTFTGPRNITLVENLFKQP
ncbi:prepilin-type N-terminal cleavage/methylation domain-containing protein [Patescibacteria group bacterium]|nr:MAG: prepilin-type N-terminal cleavage/methylation domain-containing protein [Patescibacteria group bacterium]